MQKKKGKSPAFQVYPKDALSDEIYQLMSNRQKGIYWDFLMRTWIEGSLPSDISELAMLAKEDVRDFEGLWPLISRKFKLRGKRLVNLRLLKEKRKQKNYSKMMSKNAKKLWDEKSKLESESVSIKSENVELPSKPSHSVGNALQFAVCSLQTTSKQQLLSAGAQDPQIPQVTVLKSSKPDDPPKPHEVVNPKNLHPLQKVVYGWKTILGVPLADKAWDKMNYGRCVKPAKKLLEFFEGDFTAAIECMTDVHADITSKLDKEGKPFGCSIETVNSKAWDWRASHAKVNS